MVHLKIIGVKYIVIAVIVFSLFSIVARATLASLFLISILVTGISYIIGDLIILRKFGNFIAAIADFGLAFASIWILGGLLFPETIPVTILSLAAAYLITCSELFVHIYIENQFSDELERDFRFQRQLQTEFAEETDTQTIIRKQEGKDK